MSFIGIIALVLAILVIYDVWNNNNQLDQTQKLIWTLAAIFFNILTAIIYFFAFKRK